MRTGRLLSRRSFVRAGAAGIALGLAGCRSPAASVQHRAQRVASVGGGDFELHAVQFRQRSTRLTYMGMDEQGAIWAGSGERAINRYDPRSGELTSIAHPFQGATVSQCICRGSRVYMLGMAYPRLMIYDRASGRFSERAYPVEKPEVWYSAKEVSGSIGGKHLYLFDRRAGIIKWDTEAERGTLIAYPYKTPMPYGARYLPAENALWCDVWDFSRGQYLPLGLARLDLATDRFTGWFPFPRDDAGLAAYSDPDNTLFLQWTFEGKLMPFDVRRQRFCRFVDMPGYRQRFSWIGMSAVHRGRWYYVLATLTPDGGGFDGKPYHFLNALLEFDPRTARFRYLTLDADGAYYQVSYLLSNGGEFYATCNNILRSDGVLDIGHAGELAFWQTVKPA